MSQKFEDKGKVDERALVKLVLVVVVGVVVATCWGLVVGSVVIVVVAGRDILIF